MEFSPVMNLHRKQEFSDLTIDLCLICQKKKGNESLVKNKKEGRITEIIRQLEEHHEHGTGKYTLLYNAIKKKDINELQAYSYHYSCSQSVARNYVYVKRAIEAREKEVSQEQSPSNNRVSRSALQAFDTNLCLFCQDDTTESLHEIMQDSTDDILKEAFVECPISLEIFKIRSEKARDARAGDLKYHCSCWNRHILRRIPDFPSTEAGEAPLEADNTTNSICDDLAVGMVELPMAISNAISRNSRALIVAELMEGIKESLACGRILTVRGVVNVYDTRVREIGRRDERVFSSKRKWMRKCIWDNINNIRFESLPNESQRIISTDLDGLILSLAEKKSAEDEEDDVYVLRKAAKILRKTCQEYKRSNPMTFTGSVKIESNKSPTYLVSFLSWVLGGVRSMDGDVDMEVEGRSATIASNILYSMLSDRQINYKPKTNQRKRSKYCTKQAIGMALAIRQYDRNNRVLKLLSSPNFKICISDKQCVKWETRLANAVIDNMTENNNVYIPHNLQKDVLPLFHIDNIDFIEDTPDGKGTTHALIMSVFQKRVADPVPFYLDVNQKTSSLTLKSNSFNELQYYPKPQKELCSRSNGCSNFTRDNVSVKKSKTFQIWKFMRSFERLLQVTKEDFWMDVTVPLAENQDPPTKITQPPFPTLSAGDDQSTNLNEMYWIEQILASRELCVIQENSSDAASDLSSSMETESEKAKMDTAIQNNVDYVQIFKEAAAQMLHSLVIPSVGAINSFVSGVPVSKTNVFACPLIPGPASDFSALYTSMKRAEGVTSWACGNSSMTVISLDLDLFEKFYLIVRSNESLRKKYILCLGELHVVFAHIRAIGSYICESGIDSAWMNADWFDSECVLRQVLECKHMKRALQAHEATLVVISTLFLEQLVKLFPDKFLNMVDTLQNVIAEVREGVTEQTNTVVLSAFAKFQNLMDELKLDELMEEVDAKYGGSKQYQFLKIYQNMVERLFTFIEASRTRNWELHLSAAANMMKDLCSMDRIKYRRMWAVYIADMKQLQYDHPEIWKHFSEGNFSVQKSMIPGTAIGRDHAGEQQVRELKTRGGIKGITRNENSRTRHFLVAPLLSAISEEMELIGHGQKLESNVTHHQLSSSYTTLQNKRIGALLDVFESHNFEIFPEENVMKNIVTGQIYPDDVCNDILSVEKVGDELYDAFVKERLQTDSTVDILAPIKKVSLKTFKSCNKKQVMKLKDRVVVLQENCNLFGRCAILSQSRTVNMKEVIGDHELTVTSRSLMSASGKLHDGGENKSDLVKVVINHCKVPRMNTNLQPDCFVVDSMALLHSWKKTKWVLTGKDLGDAFCQRILELGGTASSYILCFDTYSENSLKSGTWEIRSTKKEARKTKPPRRYNIESSTSLKQVTVKDLLGHIKTKQSLTQFLVAHAKTFFQNLGTVLYIVAGDGQTYSNIGMEENNHEEGDTLIIHCLCRASLNDLKVVVYANDTDIFVLLLRHMSTIACKQIYMQTSVQEFIDVTAIFQVLTEDVSSALLSLHCMTGCDTVGKFAGKSKERWTKEFLKIERNSKTIEALIKFQYQEDEWITDELEQFVCSVYNPRSNPDQRSLRETRYFLFSKNAADSEKLPPTKGSFHYHLKRSHRQLNVWHQAPLAMIEEKERSEYGWEEINDTWMPKTTDGLIAPKSIIEMVSCGCEGNCLKKRCSCQKTGQNCTDVCGCGDLCENTDPVPSVENGSILDSGFDEY